MQNKSIGVNFGIGIGAYLLLILLAKQNTELLKFSPTLIVVGIVCIYLMIGFMQQEDGIWGGRIAVILPYIIGSIVYCAARISKNQELIALFRKILPQVYQPLDKLILALDQRLSRDVLTIILGIIMLVIGLAMLEIGRKIKSSNKTIYKFIYNTAVVWGVHFYLFLGVFAVVKKNPYFLTDNRLKTLFAVGMTLVLFIVYFLTGRACRTINQKVLQFLSCVSISVTALMMYGFGMLLVWDIGIYERYILPVATSFIGTICKAIGVATGAKGLVISQYGLAASMIMILMPTVLIFVGKLTSIGDESKIDLGIDLSSEIEIETP